MSTKHRVVIDGSALSYEDVVHVAHGDALADLAPAGVQRMENARRVLDVAIAEGRTMYGVTTGLGAMASTRIDPSDAAELQISLLRSHATGVGLPLSPPVVRLMLLLRARTLAAGHSGVRPVIVERILDLYNRDLLPVVPDIGSVGASGDLAPFAHLALPLIGEGELTDAGTRAPAAEVLSRHGLEPIHLEAKEGLSLLNGTEGMLAWGMLGVHRARRLAAAADIACAMSVEALMGSARPFQPTVHELKPHRGQRITAANIARLIEGSEIEASHRDDFVHAVQDAYSLRCAPQVHGAARDAFEYAAGVFSVEAASVTDNPLVFPDTGDVVSAGNFHGQPLAFALDFMTIAATGLASISERRTDRMLDPQHSSGLPPFLTARPGLQSGLMLTQYTAAALVAEARVLSHPASVDSIPTSGSQEDHNSMGWGAGRKLHMTLDFAFRVVAIELICAAQGIEYRDGAPGKGTGAALAALREVVAPWTDDRMPAPDIEATWGLIDEAGFYETIAAEVGEVA